MSKFIKDTLKEIEISGIRQFNQLASNVDDVIKLTLGELDFNTPDSIKDAIKDALDNNHTRYTVNAGIEELRVEIAKEFKHYSKDEIIITVGTTEGLSTVIKSVISKEDEVIIPTPGYVGYKPLILLEGGTVKEVDVLKTNFNITKESLENAYTTKTKAMIVTNPNNPTGKILSDDEMNIIKDFVLEKDILLLSDEIYSEIDFDFKFKSFTDFEELKENLICLNGFSKSHAMTGLRVGYILGDIEVINNLLKTHQYSVTSAASISQYAALEAMNVNSTFITKTLKKRRDFLIQKLDEMKLPYITPDGAFYIFVDIKDYATSSTKFCEDLLYKQRVACIPGEAFLGDNKTYIRLSYATDMESLDEAMKRLKAFIKKN